MAHRIISPGSVSAAADIGGTQFIPGVEPGGSRAGKDKPMLLIKDLWAELSDIVVSASDEEIRSRVFLKLSQELDLTPGLILPIAGFAGDIVEVTAVGHDVVAPAIEQLGSRFAGTIWAPRVVGLRVTMSGLTSVNWVVHVDYERVLVPWMDWFIAWDFLDNVVDNTRNF